MKVILGKDISGGVAAGVWRLGGGGNLGKFLSLNPLHYLIVPPFNLTQCSSRQYAGVRLKTVMNPSNIAVYFTFRLNSSKQWREAIGFNICHWFHRTTAPRVPLCSDLKLHRPLLFIFTPFSIEVITFTSSSMHWSPFKNIIIIIIILIGMGTTAGKQRETI